MTKEKIKTLDKHYLTLYALMDSSFWFDTIILGQAIVYMDGTGYNLQIKIVFLSLKIVFVLANSADADKMLH